MQWMIPTCMPQRRRKSSYHFFTLSLVMIIRSLTHVECTIVRDESWWLSIISSLMFTMTSVTVLTLLIHSSLSSFPLSVPAPLQHHFNVSNSNLDSSHSRVPRQVWSHDGLVLKVPEAVESHYRDRRHSQRSGRQIVPGVYSCGHQGKDQFINFINPHYPSPDNVAGTCHFRWETLTQTVLMK